MIYVEHDRYIDPPSPSGSDSIESEDSLLVRNLTLTKPVFSVYHLRPATRFEATIYSSNRKGRSAPSLLRVSTLKRPSEKRLATTASGRTQIRLFRPKALGTRLVLRR